MSNGIILRCVVRQLQIAVTSGCGLEFQIVHFDFVQSHLHRSICIHSYMYMLDSIYYVHSASDDYTQTHQFGAPYSKSNTLNDVARNQTNLLLSVYVQTVLNMQIMFIWVDCLSGVAPRSLMLSAMGLGLCESKHIHPPYNMMCRFVGVQHKSGWRLKH